jgi:cell division protein FtsZ
VIAEIARDLGALTIGVVTKPFTFEGARRRLNAEKASEALKEKVDTLITIPNDRLKDVVKKETTIVDAFRVVDDVLRHGVQGISDLITVPGLINLDFADVRTIMKDAGSALMGIGRATGQNRAAEAARIATSSPLLEINISGAQGVLFSISGGSDLSLFEVEEAAAIIKETADPEANIIFGTVVDDRMGDEVSITVIATGFDSKRIAQAAAASRPAAAPATVSAGLQTGRENAAYVREMDQRAAQPTPAPEPVAQQPQPQAPVYQEPAAPAYQPPAPQPAPPPARQAQEVEDLDIPAFLRRNSGR